MEGGRMEGRGMKRQWRGEERDERRDDGPVVRQPSGILVEQRGSTAAIYCLVTRRLCTTHGRFKCQSQMRQDFGIKSTNITHP